MGDQPTPTADQDTETYELDLDSAGEDDVEEAMRSALDAVESRQRTTEADEEDGAEDARSGDEDGAQAPRAKADDSSEVAELKTRLLRTLADFDNFRKRTEREKETLRRFAVSEVVKDVLGVVDNLERAMAASGSIDELKQGLEMILRQQNEVMKRFGVQTIEAADQPFDPSVHEAVAREDSPEVTVPTVIRELQKGYKIHDRLLRPAMVHVAMPSSPPADPAAETSKAKGEDPNGDSE